MKHFIYLLVLLLSYSKASKAQYQEGLDPYFGNKGIATFSESIIPYVGFTDAVLQPDGKIIAATIKNIIRLNADGSIDNSFGKDGLFNETVLYPSGVPVDNLLVPLLAIQADGKLIVSAADEKIPDSETKHFLIRINSDGTVDKTFGIGGKSPIEDGGGILKIQPDGKILSYSDINDTLRIERYLSTGILDSSFGYFGRVKDTKLAVAFSPKIDLDMHGKIVVLLDDFGVARYLTDGRPDSSFNHIGYNYIFDNSFGGPFSTAMAVRPDGKIWVAGNTLFGGATKFILGRFNADGSIDSTFNSVGYQEYATDTGNENKLRDMLLLPDGKVALGGRVMNRATKHYNFGLMRIHPDGREDSTFGANGRLLTAPNGWAEASADLSKLLLQAADSKILGFGRSNTGTGIYTPFSTIVRYYGNGKTTIAEKANQDKFSVYPNPASDIVNIVLPNAANIEYLSISNIHGQVINTWSASPIYNSIDVTNLANGVYFLRITMDGITSHQKIMIQH